MYRLTEPLYEPWLQAWQRSLREGADDGARRRRSRARQCRVLERTSSAGRGSSRGR